MIHSALDIFRCEGGMFDIEPCEMDLDVGKRGRFLEPVENSEFEIVGVQRNSKWEIVYRVVCDNDKRRFGRTAHPNEIEIFGGDHV